MTIMDMVWQSILVERSHHLINRLEGHTGSRQYSTVAGDPPGHTYNNHRLPLLHLGAQRAAIRMHKPF
jgi:hypothetical protein